MGGVLLAAGMSFFATGQEPAHRHGQPERRTAAGEKPGSEAHQHPMEHLPGMKHANMDHDMSPAGMFLMNQSSGTGFQPEAWPMPMAMTRSGDWSLMWMGQAF